MSFHSANNIVLTLHINIVYSLYIERKKSIAALKTSGMNELSNVLLLNLFLILFVNFISFVGFFPLFSRRVNWHSRLFFLHLEKQWM